MINEMLISQEEQESLRKKDKLRKAGQTFIRVINLGPIGFNYIHAIDDIKLDEYTDPDTGQPKYEQRRGGSTICFTEDRITGDRVADILDTEFNRYFLARHLTLDGRPFLVIDDKKKAREINALVHKKFEVEPARKEILRREKVEIERELTRIKHEEEKERKKERGDSMESNKPGQIKAVLDRVKETITQPKVDSPTVGV